MLCWRIGPCMALFRGTLTLKVQEKAFLLCKVIPSLKQILSSKKRFAVSNIGAYYVQSDLPEDHLIPFHGIIWIDEESPENPSHPNNPLRGHADLTSRCLLLGHQPIVYPQGKKGVSNSLKLINH